MQSKPSRIGLIGFGAAANGLARGFSEQGALVTVYCDGPHNRPPYTDEFRRKVAAAGARVADSLADLAAASDVIFFAAAFTASVETANRIAPFLRDGTIYADISNAPPAVKGEACRAFSGARALYVDVGVLGDISGKGPRTEVVVSGAGAGAFCERMVPFGMHADIVGTEAGKAAVLKMLANVFTKGLAALAFEVMLPAERLGLTEEVYRHALKRLDDQPLSQFVTERLCAPVVHAARRAQEMAAIVVELEALGSDPVVTRATRDVHLHLAELGTREAFEARVPTDWRHALRVVVALEDRTRVKTEEAP